MRSPFLVSIGDLTTPGARRREQVEADVDWAVEMSALDGPLRADLEVSAVSGGHLVRGTARAPVRHTCHRCLGEFVAEHAVPVSAMFLSEPDDESYWTDGLELDVEQMLRDEVLLAMPLLPRCGDDCSGVVSGTGAGLNTMFPGSSGPAGEEADGSDSPFEALRGLLDPG